MARPAKGGSMDAVEATDEGLRLLVVQELDYMHTLWWMYMNRVCPALPSWLAPYPYNPVSFLDTLEGTIAM